MNTIQAHHFNLEILREYDIRGVVTEDLQPEVVVQLGKGIGTLIR